MCTVYWELFDQLGFSNWNMLNLQKMKNEMVIIEPPLLAQLILMCNMAFLPLKLGAQQTNEPFDCLHIL